MTEGATVSATDEPAPSVAEEEPKGFRNIAQALTAKYGSGYVQTLRKSVKRKGKRG